MKKNILTLLVLALAHFTSPTAFQAEITDGKCASLSVNPSSGTVGTRVFTVANCPASMDGNSYILRISLGNLVYDYSSVLIISGRSDPISIPIPPPPPSFPPGPHPGTYTAVLVDIINPSIQRSVVATFTVDITAPPVPIQCCNIPPVNMCGAITSGSCSPVAGGGVTICPDNCAFLRRVTCGSQIHYVCTLPPNCGTRNQRCCNSTEDIFSCGFLTGLYCDTSDTSLGPEGKCKSIHPRGDCDNGINTALGCINITGKPTIQTILNWGVGIGGGIALLTAIIAALQITTARGDAKRVKAGQELLTAALAGLFLIALSIVILNFIGLNILGLGNLGFRQ